MTTSTPMSRRHIPAASVKGLVSLPLRLFRLLCTWQARYEERETLKTLDRDQMVDIGLTESRRQAELKKPFWGPGE